jgi:hypothetical protein
MAIPLPISSAEERLLATPCLCTLAKTCSQSLLDFWTTLCHAFTDACSRQSQSWWIRRRLHKKCLVDWGARKHLAGDLGAASKDLSSQQSVFETPYTRDLIIQYCVGKSSELNSSLNTPIYGWLYEIQDDHSSYLSPTAKTIRAYRRNGSMCHCLSARVNSRCADG